MGMGAIGGGINPVKISPGGPGGISGPANNVPKFPNLGKISPGGPGGVFGVMPPGQTSPGQTSPGLRTNSQGMFNPAQMMGPVVPQGMAPGGGFGMPAQTMPNAVRNSQQNYNTNIRGPGRR
jgi:hypothetical protein